MNVPKMATIGGIQIGYSTQEEIEQSWGAGLTVVGGHPNSGRRWRVRDTDWIIATDGFLYSDRGLVIDALQMESQPAEESSTNVPFAKPDKSSFAWLGDISRGMTKPEVIAALNQHSLKFKSQANVLILDEAGFSSITSEANANLHHWRATLNFKDGKLNSLNLSAG